MEEEGGVVYSYDCLGKIKGYDPAEVWMQVEGGEGATQVLVWGHAGGSWGLMCLVWEGKDGRRATMAMLICCSGIEISRTEDGG